VRSSIASLAAENAACVREDALAALRSIGLEAPTIDGADGIMLASSGDAASGTAAALVSAWEIAGPAIVFTGYLPPGTPAERLTTTGRARYLRWPVHPRLPDNSRLVKSSAALTVLPAFGDAAHLEAWQAAFSPARVVLKGPVAL
jgi:hypothetical protein